MVNGAGGHIDVQVGRGGTGRLTGGAGRTLQLITITVRAALVLGQSLEFSRVLSRSAITGSLTTGAGSKLRMEGGNIPIGGAGQATLTVANGFTNLGTIELTSKIGRASCREIA